MRQMSSTPDSSTSSRPTTRHVGFEHVSNVLEVRVSLLLSLAAERRIFRRVVRVLLTERGGEDAFQLPIFCCPGGGLGRRGLLLGGEGGEQAGSAGSEGDGEKEKI